MLKFAFNSEKEKSNTTTQHPDFQRNVEFALAWTFNFKNKKSPFEWTPYIKITLEKTLKNDPSHLLFVVTNHSTIVECNQNHDDFIKNMKLALQWAKEKAKKQMNIESESNKTSQDQIECGLNDHQLNKTPSPISTRQPNNKPQPIQNPRPYD